MQSAATGGATTYYQYNADGIRTQKQTGDLVTEYFLVDGKAIGEVVRDPWGYYFYWLRYTFDENGQIIGFGCWVLGDTAWTEYYFAKNLQGDVIGVYRASDNEQVAEYQYDAWGNIIYKSGDLADINPFRYRTYYYDNETWFYYLQSRYYDPAIGRFINADDTAYLGADGSLLGYNLFAYCDNTPVILQDPLGNSAILTTLGIMAIGGVIGAAVSAFSSAITQKALTGSVNWKSVGISAATGFVSGAVAASPLGTGWQIAVGGAIGGLSYVADCSVNSKPINTGEALLSTVTGMASGAIGGPGANKGMVLTDAIEHMGTVAAREARRANQEYATKAIANSAYYYSNVIAGSAWEASIRFSAGCGVANGVNTKVNELGWFSNWPTLSLW